MEIGRGIKTPDQEMRESAATMTGSSSDLRFPLNLSQGELQHYMTFEISEFQKLAYQPGDVASDGSTTPHNPHTTISLYIPEQIAMKSTASYENMGLNFASEFFVNQQGEEGGIGNFFTDTGTEVGSKLLTTFGDFVANEAGEIGRQNLTGTASNAGKVVLFRGIDFRTFNFSYKFAPRNQDESNAVANIIKQFRKGMLPSIEGGGMFYSIPDTFQITYKVMGSGDTGAKYLHKFKTCSLLDCDVQYGGDGTFGVFRSGAPTNVQMTLTFQETLQVTKDDVDKDY